VSGGAALRRGAVAAIACAVTAFLILPIFVVLPVSLTTKSYLSLPEEGVTLDHYGRLFGDPAWLAGLLNSALIATAATASSLVLGTAFAVGAWRLAGRTMAALYLMLLAPMVLPPIVYSVALFRLWAELRLLDTYPGTIVAHTVLALPFVVITVGTSLSALDPRIEFAARSLGATPLQAVRRVILPNIVPGMAAGGLFAFVTSWDEIVVTLFITARRVVTLPRKIWEGVIDAIDPRIAAVGTLLIAFTLVLLAVDAALARRRRMAAALPTST
jgi:putative spermidine/putrescine transport system permease protein